MSTPPQPVGPEAMSALEVGRLARRLGRWSEFLAFEEAQVARREVRTGCPLSDRQLEVFGLLATGEMASLKDVARRLGIDLKTVHNHVGAAARACGTSGTTQTLVVALQQGWVSLAPPADAEAA
jgi:DNA-binding NarL/FixJ family response regulator